MMPHRPIGLLVAALLVGALLAPGAAATGEATPPQQPASGPGGRAAAFRAVEAERFGAAPRGFWIFSPVDPVAPADSAEPLPVVVFLHGFTAVDPEVYGAWIEHIVRRGAVVIYPDYQTANPFETGWGEMLVHAVAAIDGARRELARRPGSAVELEQMSLVGHSLGAVLAVGVAAIATEYGLPRPVALMPVQLGGCLGCADAAPSIGVPVPDLAGIPAETRLVMVVAVDDGVVGDAAAAALWDRIGSIPETRRDYVVLRSDDHGVPPLRADHALAQTGGPRGTINALDWYGTWKLFDLLLACAHAGEGCERAMGGSASQTEMGTWSDGTAVVAPLIGDEPFGLAQD
jgi:hypothetical protein